MDLAELIKWGAYVLTGIIGFFVKVLWDAVTKLKDDLHEIEVRFTENFVRKDEVAAAFQEMKQHLVRIEDYLLKRKDDD